MELDGDVVRFTPEEEQRMTEELDNEVLRALRDCWACCEQIHRILLGDQMPY